LYAIRYDWPLWSYLATAIGGEDGKLPLSASMAVLNEPSTGATPPADITC
jgi:hypothetical protein